MLGALLILALGCSLSFVDLHTFGRDLGRAGAAVANVLGPGDVFHNYLLEELVGEGGMGRVYRARHQLLGRLAAVKVIACAKGSSASSVKLPANPGDGCGGGGGGFALVSVNAIVSLTTVSLSSAAGGVGGVGDHDALKAGLAQLLPVETEELRLIRDAALRDADGIRNEFDLRRDGSLRILKFIPRWMSEPTESTGTWTLDGKVLTLNAEGFVTRCHVTVPELHCKKEAGNEREPPTIFRRVP